MATPRARTHMGRQPTARLMTAPRMNRRRAEVTVRTSVDLFMRRLVRAMCLRTGKGSESAAKGLEPGWSAPSTTAASVRGRMSTRYESKSATILIDSARHCKRVDSWTTGVLYMATASDQKVTKFSRPPAKVTSPSKTPHHRVHVSAPVLTKVAQYGSKVVKTKIRELRRTESTAVHARYWRPRSPAQDCLAQGQYSSPSTCRANIESGPASGASESTPAIPTMVCHRHSSTSGRPSASAGDSGHAASHHTVIECSGMSASATQPAAIFAGPNGEVVPAVTEYSPEATVPATPAMATRRYTRQNGPTTASCRRVKCPYAGPQRAAAAIKSAQEGGCSLAKATAASASASAPAARSGSSAGSGRMFGSTARSSEGVIAGKRSGRRYQVWNVRRTAGT
ncbi:hypothetical protein DFJ74DRAFT_669456 [Hyaloraphidium curvatum]|nr:hypothetical protein DFJ74DRAFT_669456 [Hyaloraphidium curvatum]